MVSHEHLRAVPFLKDHPFRLSDIEPEHALEIQEPWDPRS